MPVRLASATVRQLLVLSAAAGLATSLFNYFSQGSGIALTAGALLVVASTALLLILCIVLFLPLPRWLNALVYIGIVLDVVGTGFAGYFLETDALMAFMGVGLIAWVVDVLKRVVGASRRTPPAMSGHAA